MEIPISLSNHAQISPHSSSASETVSPSTIEPLAPPLGDALQANPEDEFYLPYPATGDLKFKANADLLQLCAMDTMMPSPTRRLEGIFEPPISGNAALFLNGDPVCPILPHASLVTVQNEPLSTPEVREMPVNSHLGFSSQLQIKETPKSMAPALLQASTFHGDVHSEKSSQSHSRPKGAWASPLKSSTIFTSAANAPDSSFQNSAENLSVLSPNENWPALSKHPPKRRQLPLAAPTHPLKWAAKPTNALNPTSPDILKASQEYPWAAKMRSVCNLRRVTTPVFMEDGTPKVSIPSHVLLEGLENQKEFVVGQFFRCAAPSGGHIHAVVSRIWGRNCQISARKLGESSYLFHIPHEATRKWVTQRGLWHVDDCLMFVSAWSPSPTISLPEISTIPVWLTLKNIPYQLYSIKGIDWIASAIGEPMLTSKPWLDPTQMGEAKILVEVKLNKQFPHKVALEDESGSISMVDVVYSWLPSKCNSCGQLGHKSAYCLGLGIHSTPIAGSSLDCDTTSVPPSLKAAGVISRSVPAFDSALTSKPPSVINATTTSTSVINVELAAGLVSASVSHGSPELSSVVSNVATTFRQEHLSVSTAPKTNNVSALEPLINDVETTTSITDLTASKVADISVINSTITEPAAFPEQQTGAHTSSLTATPSSPMEAEYKSTTVLVHPISEVEVVIPVADNSIISSVIDLDLGGTVCRDAETGSRLVRAQGNNPFALLDESEPLDTFQEVDLSLSQKTLRGRTVKPSQKVQEMQWTMVGGRGSRGRGGRGGRGNHN